MQFPPSNYPRPQLDDLEALRRIAKGQRRILLSLLAQIGLVLLGVAAMAGTTPVLAIVGWELLPVVLVFMILSVVKLAGALRVSPVLPVFCMFVPCVSLITLLVLNGMASSRLQQGGVKVGLLGANPKSI